MEIGVSTLGKIELNKSPEEGYNLTKAVLDTLGLKIKEKDDEKFFLKSKTKMSWIKNKFGKDFRILVRPAGSFCVIEIYSNITSMSGGPDPSFIVDPFYHQLSQLISEQPPIDVGVINIKTKEVLELAGKPVTAHNASNQAISVADEIAKIAKLKEEGTLSEEEYQKMKNELIDKM